FQPPVAATRNDGVVGAGRRRAIASDGRGWARDIVERLCVDRAGRLTETCDRDGTREHYFSPRAPAVGRVLAGAAPANVRCVWSFEDGAGDPRQVEAACDDEV